jgi:hypothetical protein
VVSRILLAGPEQYKDANCPPAQSRKGDVPDLGPTFYRTSADAFAALERHRDLLDPARAARLPGAQDSQ